MWATTNGDGKIQQLIKNKLIYTLVSLRRMHYIFLLMKAMKYDSVYKLLK